MVQILLLELRIKCVRCKDREVTLLGINKDVLELRTIFHSNYLLPHPRKNLDSFTSAHAQIS